jgi:serine protease Do
MSWDRSYLNRVAPVWCAGLAAVALAVVSQRAVAGPQATGAAPPAATVQPGPYTEFHSPFVRVAEITSPAVVYIEVRKGANAKRRAGGPFDDFLHDFVPRGRRPQEMPSSGSGFVMDPRGFILTNNHVIEEADELQVTFLNGESYACEVVGQDPRTDIAVIRITERSRSGRPFPALQLGDSDEIKIGDWAIAVGNPFGQTLAGTVTVGVISAKGRSDLNIMGADIDLQDFIQTDASINFGNSGGPLVNIRGEVIGINSALNTQGQGISFAIPINLAASVAQQLIATGHVRRGYLGIILDELTPEVAQGQGLGNLRGRAHHRCAGRQPGATRRTATGRRHRRVRRQAGAARTPVPPHRRRHRCRQERQHEAVPRRQISRRQGDAR